jgi:hypothetical protein
MRSVTVTHPKPICIYALQLNQSPIFLQEVQHTWHKNSRTYKVSRFVLACILNQLIKQIFFKELELAT